MASFLSSVYTGAVNALQKLNTDATHYAKTGQLPQEPEKSQSLHLPPDFSSSSQHFEPLRPSPSPPLPIHPGKLKWYERQVIFLGYSINPITPNKSEYFTQLKQKTQESLNQIKGDLAGHFSNISPESPPLEAPLDVERKKAEHKKQIQIFKHNLVALIIYRILNGSAGRSQFDYSVFADIKKQIETPDSSTSLWQIFYTNNYKNEKKDELQKKGWAPLTTIQKIKVAIAYFFLFYLTNLIPSIITSLIDNINTGFEKLANPTHQHTTAKIANLICNGLIELCGFFNTRAAGVQALREENKERKAKGQKEITEEECIKRHIELKMSLSEYKTVCSKSSKLITKIFYKSVTNNFFGRFFDPIIKLFIQHMIKNFLVETKKKPANANDQEQLAPPQDVGSLAVTLAVYTTVHTQLKNLLESLPNPSLTQLPKELPDRGDLEKQLKTTSRALIEAYPCTKSDKSKAPGIQGIMFTGLSTSYNKMEEIFANMVEKTNINFNQIGTRYAHEYTADIKKEFEQIDQLMKEVFSWFIETNATNKIKRNEKQVDTAYAQRKVAFSKSLTFISNKLKNFSSFSNIDQFAQSIVTCQQTLSELLAQIRPNNLSENNPAPLQDELYRAMIPLLENLQSFPIELGKISINLVDFIKKKQLIEAHDNLLKILKNLNQIKYDSNIVFKDFQKELNKFIKHPNNSQIIHLDELQTEINGLVDEQILYQNQNQLLQLLKNAKDLNALKKHSPTQKRIQDILKETDHSWSTFQSFAKQQPNGTLFEELLNAAKTSIMDGKDADLPFPVPAAEFLQWFNENQDSWSHLGDQLGFLEEDLIEKKKLLHTYLAHPNNKMHYVYWFSHRRALNDDCQKRERSIQAKFQKIQEDTLPSLIQTLEAQRKTLLEQQQSLESERQKSHENMTFLAENLTNLTNNLTPEPIIAFESLAKIAAQGAKTIILPWITDLVVAILEDSKKKHIQDYMKYIGLRLFNLYHSLPS